jgi:lipoate-protein ligase B
MIQTLYLGRVGYSDALRLQAEIAVLVAEGRARNVLLLLEHPACADAGAQRRP